MPPQLSSFELHPARFDLRAVSHIVTDMVTKARKKSSLKSLFTRGFLPWSCSATKPARPGFRVGQNYPRFTSSMVARRMPKSPSTPSRMAAIPGLAASGTWPKKKSAKPATPSTPTKPSGASWSPGKSQARAASRNRVFLPQRNEGTPREADNLIRLPRFLQKQETSAAGAKVSLLEEELETSRRPRNHHHC